MAEMDDDTLVIDDISQYETEKLIELYKPDIFCAGIKEKYVVQKMGVPCKQLHSYDYGGPYAAFRGAIRLIPVAAFKGRGSMMHSCATRPFAPVYSTW